MKGPHMDVWVLLLFAAAAALALRSLLDLMTRHKEEYTRQLSLEEAMRRRAEAKAKKLQESGEQNREAA